MNRPYADDKLTTGNPDLSLFDPANAEILAADAIPYLPDTHEQLLGVAKDIDVDPEMPPYQRDAYRKAFIAGIRFARHVENRFADAGIEPTVSDMAAAVTDLYDRVIRADGLRFPVQAIPALTAVMRAWTRGDLFVQAVSGLREVMTGELRRAECSDPDCPTCGTNAMKAHGAALDQGVKDKLKAILAEATAQMESPTVAPTRRRDAAQLMADVMSGKDVDDPRLLKLAPGAVLIRLEPEDDADAHRDSNPS